MMFTEFHNRLITGRASCGIFLILRQYFSAGEVIVPANICYAAVYPIIYAGLVPVFCDVEPSSGNVDLQCVKQKFSSSTKAVIIPHMYGNPVPCIRDIKHWCSEKNVLFIEDCASAMGAGCPQNPVGESGDYILHSTGYSKIISLGYGGIIESNFDLSKLEQEEANLPEWDRDWDGLTQIFSKQYRQYRNSGKNILESDFKSYFCETDFRKLFIFRCPENWKQNVAFSVEQDLKHAVKIHRDGWMCYHEAVSKIETEYCKEYQYGAGAVPWRYSLIVDPSIRRAYIDFLLKEKVPVSDWYPAVTDLFLKFDKYPGVEYLEKRILNFPLAISNDTIKQICDLIIKGFQQTC